MRYFAYAVCAAGLVLSACGCDASSSAKSAPPTPVAAANQPREIVFCHWNVENFFDDKNDGRTGPGDREYDAWFAEHPDMLKLKLAHITEAILKINAGKGPDILAIVEVESIRAAELLQQALNAQIADASLHYSHVLMKEVAAGRHIAPAILTRLPVIKDRTRTLDNKHRILVGHIKVNDHELVVIASHWTSRLQETGKNGRANYADKIYGFCNGMFKSNPAVDFIISGDFNDDPDDEAVVQHLHSTALPSPPRASGAGGEGAGDSLHPFNLLAGKDAKGFGTHYYKQWHIFDQILVSPGMLDDRGWSCEVQSVHVENEWHKAKDKQKRPWRFGGPNEKGERGYSDHFPVTVKLRVN